MAIVKPFNAIRPAATLADQVAALPYDVYNREEACRAVSGKPLSFLNIDRAETQFPDDVDTYADCVYEKAALLLNHFMESKIFITEEKPCYYLYALTMNGRTQTGIAGCSAIDDYQNNIVKKHENTREEKELDRIKHVDTCSAQTGPIFLTYRHNNTLHDLIAEAKKQPPVYDFTTEDDIRHQLYLVNDDEMIHAMEAALLTLPSTYIADGHHRAASAVKVGLERRRTNPAYSGEEDFNYFLSVLFPDDELMILPYNRVVKDLNTLSLDALLAEIKISFDIEEIGASAYAPTQKGTFGMFVGDIWYKLTAKETICSDDPVKGLDVSILQDFLLGPVLGIGDPRVDKRIDFIGGIRGLAELEQRVHTDMQIAFSMYPTSIQELLDVADANLLMPPKSTWFEPKLRSGLLIHKI